MIESNVFLFNFFSGRRSNNHRKVEPKTNPIYHFLENEGLDLPISSEAGNKFGLELKKRPEEPVSSDSESEDEFGLVYKKRSKVPISSHSEIEIGSEFNKEDNTETPNNESEPDKTEMVTKEPEIVTTEPEMVTPEPEALVKDLPFVCVLAGCGKRFATRTDVEKHFQSQDHENDSRIPEKGSQAYR